MKWFVVSDGICTKVTELLVSDKQALLEPGYRIICDRNGYDNFNDAFVSMLSSKIFVVEPSVENGRPVAVEMLALP